LRESLGGLRREFELIDLDRGRVTQVLAQFEEETRLQLADWEMKGTDAARLMEKITEMTEVTRTAGLPALTDYLDGIFAELSQGRRQPGRGTHDNIPWWKLMLLAGMVGWWIALLIVAVVYRGDVAGMNAIAAAYGVIQATHLIAFALFG
jgi:hypothetical protein